MSNYSVLWLQSGGCGGCTMSLLNAESPDLYSHLSLAGIDLLWHPSLSLAGGEALLALIDDIETGARELDLLCLEGSVMHGPNGSGLFHQLSGSGRPMKDLLASLASKAKNTAAIGSCAAFGGITAAGENFAEAGGLQYDASTLGGLLGADWRSAGGFPVINIAGCPTHPNWVLDTLALMASGELCAQDLDDMNRPLSYTKHLVHHGCPRNEFYEYKASAEELGDLGCLMEHKGCLGTQAHADCNIRLWNGEGSCLRGGYSCINCTAADFQDSKRSFTQTPKVAGIPVGLPTDMPKAWFVALSTLSKAATPLRLRENATAQAIRLVPGAQVPDDE